MRTTTIGLLVALSLALPATSYALGAVGICTSVNAPGTPKGAECRCQATGPGASCAVIKETDAEPSHVACGDNGGLQETCVWEDTSDGGLCICDTPDDKDETQASRDPLLSGL